MARELRKVLTFHYLGVAIYDEKAHDMRLNLFLGESGAPLEAPKLAPEETMTWWVYQHQQPLIVPFVDEESRFPAATKLLKKLGIRSICILPLTTVHRRVGGLAIGSQESVNYSRDEVGFLSLVAHQVALAVDDALNVRRRIAHRRTYGGSKPSYKLSVTGCNCSSRSPTRLSRIWNFATSCGLSRGASGG